MERSSGGARSAGSGGQSRHATAPPVPIAPPPPPEPVIPPEPPAPPDPPDPLDALDALLDPLTVAPPPTPLLELLDALPPTPLLELLDAPPPPLEALDEVASLDVPPVGSSGSQPAQRRGARVAANISEATICDRSERR